MRTLVNCSDGIVFHQFDKILFKRQLLNHHLKTFYGVILTHKLSEFCKTVVEVFQLQFMFILVKPKFYHKKIYLNTAKN